MARPALIIALPAAESASVAAELSEAGFDPVCVGDVAQLDGVLRARADVSVAILDAEGEAGTWLDLHALLHDRGRNIPSLVVMAPADLETFVPAPSAVDDEYFTRPYSTEALRWRVEAMCIRSQTIDDGSGPVIQAGDFRAGDWTRRATIVTVFTPKGGVGKTTIATNLAAALATRKEQRVLLVDADTVTGHVASSLGLEQVRTLADSWRDELEGGDPESIVDIASGHASGMRVMSLTSSPLVTEILEPARVADALVASRRGFDFLVVDLHPSYGALNRAILARSDRILVPVTPDVPAIRAALQLRDVAIELELYERLSMVVNRTNSGLSVADMERTVGMPALALIRSAGLLLVRAANEGRTVIEMFPRERISSDFDGLADRLLGVPVPLPAARSTFRLFGRQKEPAQA